MAGSPTATGRPGLVTVPTPSPALKMIPPDRRRTFAITVAPWVTSGSSPASLTIPARAQSLPSASSTKANETSCPLGKVMFTGSGKRPVASAVKAAFVAAVAQAPVVQPRRNVCCGFSTRMRHAYKGP